MKKKVVRVFGRDNYLLGADAYGIKYYLEKESWDCGWYWGLGYVETFTNNRCPEQSRDISSHQHFDGLFLNGRNCAYDEFKEFFAETPLTDDEIWELVDLMKTAYTLRKTAEVMGRGYSHYTSRAKVEEVKKPEYVETINQIMIPAVMERVRALLTEEG